jgi:hypothetical protein
LDASINIATGQVVLTGSSNTVLITDDGQRVRVFTANDFVGSVVEGTPITVTTNTPGSSNTIFYDLQGVPASGPGPVLNSSLNVNFGFGPGSLFVEVVSSLSTSVTTRSPRPAPTAVQASTGLSSDQGSSA